MKLTLEEKFERIKDLRPIDDVFFEVFADNNAVCEEILRTILDDPKLVVEDVVVQSSERNLYSRSVRLDALCTLGSGARCNIEVQRSDNDNHLKRARYNASSITVKESQVGDRFEDVLELYIIYISEFDIFKEGKTSYHIEKIIKETGSVVDDGLHEIFINTAVKDGTKLADLMTCFVMKDVDNPQFPIFSSRVREIKFTEEGATAMCEVMEKYMAESWAEGIAKGRAEGIAEGRAEGIAKGRAEGIAKGRAEGKIEQLVELVQDDLIKIADAARKADMSEEEFMLLLK